MFRFYRLLLPIIILVYIAYKLDINPIALYVIIGLIVVISLLLINLILTPRTPEFVATENFLKSKDDIYFIGSSRVNTIYNPEIIQEYTDNLSVHTYGNELQNFTISCFMVKQLMKKHTPKVLVLDSHYICFKYSSNSILPYKTYQAILSALRSNQRQEFARIYKGSSSFIKDIILFKKFSFSSLKSLIFNQDDDRIKTGYTPIIEQRPIPLPGYCFVPDDAEFKNIKTSKRRQIHKKYKLQIIELLRLAKDFNIQLVLIDIPIYSEDLAREISSCEYSNYISSFIEKNKYDAKVINLNKNIEDLEITSSDFDDSIHLMESGSSVISHYIGDNLKEYLSHSHD